MEIKVAAGKQVVVFNDFGLDLAIYQECVDVSRS